jgi:hypothetical protein
VGWKDGIVCSGSLGSVTILRKKEIASGVCLRKCITWLTDLLVTCLEFYPAVTGTGTSHRTHSDGTEYICLHSQKATNLLVQHQGSRSLNFNCPSNPNCFRS